MITKEAVLDYLKELKEKFPNCSLYIYDDELQEMCGKLKDYKTDITGRKYVYSAIRSERAYFTEHVENILLQDKTKRSEQDIKGAMLNALLSFILVSFLQVNVYKMGFRFPLFKEMEDILCDVRLSFHHRGAKTLVGMNVSSQYPIVFKLLQKNLKADTSKAEELLKACKKSLL